MSQRISTTIAVLAFACLTVAGASKAGAGEQGGSGLVSVDQAFSLHIGRPLVTTHIGYFSRDFTGGSDRFYTFTPSLTLGLGAGFEGSAALAFEGLSSKLENEAFDRRFDLRRRDLTTRLRWTAPLGTTRLRAGVEGMLGLPLGDATRAGGTIDPSEDYDVGVMGLLSTNVGWFNFPLRVHANAGYWWSRDDGAFYDRSHPLALPISGPGAVGNDLALYGVAVEAGLRRFSLFTELVTEQFIDARGAVKAKENLWQLTPGLRTKLTSTIELTAAVSFNLSKDDPSTAFNPDVVYPDHELRVALTLGDILARERSESRQMPSEKFAVAMTPEPVAAATKDSVETTATPVPGDEPEAATPAPKAATAVVPPKAEPTPPAASADRPEIDRSRLRMIEERLDRLELQNRLKGLEDRIDKLEGRSAPEVAPAAPTAPAAADTTVTVISNPAPRPASAAVLSESAAPEKKAVVPAATAAQEDLNRRLAAIETMLAASRAAELDTTVTVAAVQPATAPGLDPALELRLASIQASMDSLKAVSAKAATAASVKAGAPAPGSTGSESVTTSRGLSAGPTVREGELAHRIATLEVELAAARAAPTVVTVQPSPREDELAQQIAQMQVQISALNAARAAAEAAATAPTPATPTPATPTPATPTPATPTPVAMPAPETTPAKATPPPALAKAAPRPFALAMGEKKVLAGPTGLPAGTNDSTFVNAELDTLAAGLRAHREVRIVLMVHGGGSDREAELTRTGAEARRLCDYLVRHGADATQVQPLGMGLAEPLYPLDSSQAANNARIEVARVY